MRLIHRSIAIAFAILLGAVAAPEAHAARTDHIVILHDSSGLPLPDCPRCAVARLRPGQTPTGLPAEIDAVIVTGHSGGGLIAGTTAQDLARIVAELAPAPELLILDTCRGMQSSVLIELARAGVRAGLVVGATFDLPAGGLDYGDLLQRDEISAEDVARSRPRSPAAA